MTINNDKPANYGTLTKRDDQTMATLGRLTCFKIELGQNFLKKAEFDNPFYKEQCEQVFNAMQSENITDQTYKSFFTESNAQKFKGNLGYHWLKSFATRKPSKHRPHINNFF